MADDFVHLHVHTEYSLLDGLSKITSLTKKIKELGMGSVAITDHGVMYGAVEFYKKCLKSRIKPIIGMEAYVTNVDLDKKPERGKVKNHHLLLLAKNLKGYKNLMKLTSIAHLEGYYYRPRIDKKTLRKYSKGLICTSSCPAGELANAIVEKDYKAAKKVATWHTDIFGKDYYLEMQKHNYKDFVGDAKNEKIKKDLIDMQEKEEKINKTVVKLSRDLGIPLVATNDAHYINREDAKAQDALLCIATGKTVEDLKRLRFIDTPDFYIKSPEEMKELFMDQSDAIENTVNIAESCNVKIELTNWFFPEYEIESGKSAVDELKYRVENGLEERVEKVTKEMKERIDYEIDTITKKGYETYFLIVADMAQWSRERGIVTNTRGSTAGSLVAYALKIVDINPLLYDLPFERFLTPWRPSPPDIDFDIADDRREEIIEYLTEKYGKEKVAQICTFGRMMAKGSVRDIARVLGYPYSTGDRISKAIPFGSQGFPMSIEKALKTSPELKDLYDSSDDAKKILDLAKQVEGNARHVSVHAAGLVIAPEEITNYAPIQLDPEGKKVITQYDMNALDPNVSPGEAVGLLKFDLLGLRNLSILGSTLEYVHESRNKKIDIHEIPLDDSKTFEILSKGETMGVFQLSGSGMTRYLKELKPERVEDLMAMVALYRPGPMAQIPEYIERKNNAEKVTYFDDRMKEFLGKSYGLLVYQDDVFMTAIKIAGYSWEEADKFRKAVGKKVPQEMERQKEKFIKGAVKNGLSKGKAEKLFKLIEPFSGYGFNKAHAASYGMVAYWTAYVKANYPVEFMCALLTAESSDTDKVAAAVNECKRMGIIVLPPDINRSNVGFKIVENKKSLDRKAIRFGLSAIKNVGEAAIEAILKERKKENFRSFPDFLSKVDSRKVNKKVLESLIKVGALSEFGTRSALLSKMDEIRSRVGRSKENKNQGSLFGDDDIKKSMKMEYLEADDNSEFSDEELQTLERELLGFSLSARPVGDLIEPFKYAATHKVFEISPKETLDELVSVAGVISDVRIVVTKRTSKEMAFVKVEDDTGSIDLVVFPRIFDKYRNMLQDNNPVLVMGKVDEREDSASLIAENIKTKESLKRSSEVFISIQKGVETDKLKRLKSLLLENPGRQKVVLLFRKNGKRLDSNVRISWSEKLAKEIQEILRNGSS